ncbi:hypothetical protein GCM10023171_04840 [Microbacterium panaciterrae]|uniref:Secreted protein n=1 Tax=Microbacterium panaciterrae TaxID=985759 RepID=A0ABP8P0N8_9MICO
MVTVTAGAVVVAGGEAGAAAHPDAPRPIVTSAATAIMRRRPVDVFTDRPPCGLPLLPAGHVPMRPAGRPSVPQPVQSHGTAGEAEWAYVYSSQVRTVEEFSVTGRSA